MSDILLSVGLQKGNIGTSQIETDLNEIINRISKNPPKVSVGLKVDQSALNNFRSQLSQIVNSVSLSNGSPITVNISGLGEISTQATQAASAMDRATGSIKRQSTTLSTVLQKYEQAHALIRKNADANNTTSQSYKGLADQVQFFKEVLETAHRESVDISTAFTKSGVDISTAIQDMTTAMSAFRAEMEHTGTSGTTTSRQLYDVVTQMKSLLNSNGSASGFKSYTELNSLYTQLSSAMADVRDNGTSVGDALAKAGIAASDISTVFDKARTSMSALKTELSDATKVTGTQLLDTFRQMKSLVSDNQNASGLGTYKELEQQVADFEAKIIDSNGHIRSTEEVLRQFGDTATEALAKSKEKMSAFRAEMEHTGVSGTAKMETLEQQIRRLDAIINETESNLKKWTSARDGYTSENYESIEREVEVLRQLRTEIAATGQIVSNFDTIVGGSTGTIKANSTAIRDAGEDTMSLTDKFGGLAEKFGSWLTVSQAIMIAIRTTKKMVSNVVELDAAMTELRKVTDETDATYERFLKNASTRAEAAGASLVDVVNATADFARLGHAIGDASKLADVALIYKNIGDGIKDVTTASKSIISTMQAFDIEASDAISIVDKFNEVGNKFAISSAGIGEAMQRSAAAMASANNTIEETIALITAANTVVQNPESVGTTLKTLSMYLRAAKTEAEEAGESTDGMADSVSKLRSAILDLTGQKVDIQLDEDTFKSTYQILKELSAVWGELTDISQANILEMIGGKRNANAVSALLKNFSVAESALQTASNAAGSALAENEKYLDSIEGRISKFQSAWQTLSNTIVDGDIVKGIVSFGTTVLHIIDSITSHFTTFDTLLLTALKGYSAYLKDGKFTKFVDRVRKSITDFVGGAKRRPF